jgi:transcription termination factor NusB
MTNTNNEKRLLAIKKVPVFEDDHVKYIVCVALDITEKYNEELKMISTFKEVFTKQMDSIDKNINNIQKNIQEANLITRRIKSERDDDSM